ncbi:Plasmodium variant antigen protein Cir/Yir/Bir, putative, partial [Plasmodium chabaudi chabaudi]
CGAINWIEKLITVNESDSSVFFKCNVMLDAYCPFKSTSRKNECHSYAEMVSSSVLFLLKSLETSYDYGDYLKNAKLAEYAILWLSYKLNKYPQNKITTLNDFYTKHIEANAQYNTKITTVSDNKTYRNIIDKKKDLMDMDINDIFKFYAPFKSLCNMYNELDKDYQDYQDCANCSQKSNEFVVSFEKLNEDPNITGNSSYRKILHTLSTDYDDFKNYFAEKCSGYSNIPALSEIKTPLILLIARKL